MKHIIFAALLSSLFSATTWAEKAELTDVMMKKTAPSADQSLLPYANIEMRHYTNTYYDSEDFLLRQEPAAHLTAQLGLSLYHGMADLYATFGVVKLAQTQQVLQRRPQIELDIYPFYGEHYSMTQYTIIDTPFSESEYDPENNDVTKHGSIVTVGLAQSLKYQGVALGSNWTLRFGGDAWTRLYSRKQDKDIDETEIEQFSLAQPDRSNDEIEGESEISSFNGELMLGLENKPILLPNLETGVSIHYTTRQEPRYFYNEEIDEMEYTFKKELTSHYRFRLALKLSERTSLINDFYHFHNGFFEGRMTGDDRRRLRNVARIQVKL